MAIFRRMDSADGMRFAVAKLTVLKVGKISECEAILKEGQYHQIKRMSEAIGKKSGLYQTNKKGAPELDEALSMGHVRRLSKEEVDRLLKA